jgi:hypothetical protein
MNAMLMMPMFMAVAMKIAKDPFGLQSTRPAKPAYEPEPDNGQDADSIPTGQALPAPTPA